MPNDTGAAGRGWLNPGPDPTELDRVDRILLGACVAIWLTALGAGVAAIVALVDLGRGHEDSSAESSTPWPLYIVIAVSAVVIVGAVPLLMRARRAAMAEPQPPARATVAPGAPQPPVRGAEARTEKLRVPPTAAGTVNPRRGDPAPRAAGVAALVQPVTSVDQLWLRCAVVLACAMGIAMVVIGISTYLMAVGSDGAAWVGYVLAGLVTLAMPAIPWFYLRELRGLPETVD